jgi:hypothetical protein
MPRGFKVISKRTVFETGSWATSRLGFKATAISAVIRCSPYLVQVLALLVLLDPLSNLLPNVSGKDRKKHAVKYLVR